MDAPEVEKLLAEDEPKETDTEDLNELEEELTLFKSKNSGHRRTGPQVSNETSETANLAFECNKCGKKLESQGLLNAHMNSHSSSKFPCDDCTECFGKSLDLEMHKIEQHEIKKNLD